MSRGAQGVPQCVCVGVWTLAAGLGVLNSVISTQVAAEKTNIFRLSAAPDVSHGVSTAPHVSCSSASPCHLSNVDLAKVRGSTWMQSRCEVSLASSGSKEMPSVGVCLEGGD